MSAITKVPYWLECVLPTFLGGVKGFKSSTLMVQRKLSILMWHLLNLLGDFIELRKSSKV